MLRVLLSLVLIVQLTVSPVFASVGQSWKPQDANSLTLGTVFEGALDGAITSGLSSAVYGTDFADGLRSSVLRNIVSLGLADVQTEIGHAFNQRDANGNPIGPGEGSAGHILLHAVAGCAAAELSGASCGAGAAAGAAQAVYAGFADNLDLSLDQERNQAELIGAVAGFFLSGGNPDNVSTAASIAVSGIVNNRQLHTHEINALRDRAKELDGVDGLSEEEWLTALTLQAMRQVDLRYSERIEDNPAAAAQLAILIEQHGASFVTELGGTLGFVNETNEDLFRNPFVNILHVTANSDFYDAALDDWAPERYQGLEDYLSATDLILLSTAHFHFDIGGDLLPEELAGVLDAAQLEAAQNLHLIGFLQQTRAAYGRLVDAREQVLATADDETYLAYARALSSAENDLIAGAQVFTNKLRVGMVRGASDEILSGIAGMITFGSDLALGAIGNEDAAIRNAERLEAILYLFNNLDQLPADVAQSFRAKAVAMDAAINDGRLDDAGRILGEFNLIAASAATGTVGVTQLTGSAVRALDNWVGNTRNGLQALSASQKVHVNRLEQQGVIIASSNPSISGTGDVSPLLSRVRGGGGTLQISRGEVSAQDLAALSRASGNEMAIYRDRLTGNLMLAEL